MGRTPRSPPSLPPYPSSDAPRANFVPVGAPSGVPTGTAQRPDHNHPTLSTSPNTEGPSHPHAWARPSAMKCTKTRCKPRTSVADLASACATASSCPQAFAAGPCRGPSVVEPDNQPRCDYEDPPETFGSSVRLWEFARVLAGAIAAAQRGDALTSKPGASKRRFGPFSRPARVSFLRPAGSVCPAFHGLACQHSDDSLPPRRVPRLIPHAPARLRRSTTNLQHPPPRRTPATPSASPSSAMVRPP